MIETRIETRHFGKVEIRVGPDRGYSTCLDIRTRTEEGELSIGSSTITGDMRRLGWYIVITDPEIYKAVTSCEDRSLWVGIAFKKIMEAFIESDKMTDLLRITAESAAKRAYAEGRNSKVDEWEKLFERDTCY